MTDASPVHEEDDHDHDHHHDHHHHVPRPPGSPVRRRLDLRSFDEMIDEARRLSRNGYEMAGKWDLAQICEHLAGAMNAQIDGLSSKVPWPVRLVARFFIKDALFRSRRIREGVSSPPELREPKGGDEQEAITRLEAAANRIKEHEGFSHPHPYFGKFTNDQWRNFHLIHASHHLGFLLPRE